MKYNYTSYDDDGQKLYKGIIELEPIDEPVTIGENLELECEYCGTKKNVEPIDESEETHFDEIYEEARQSAPESKMVKHTEETLE